MMETRYLGIDIGNTNQTVALADARGELLAVERRQTDPSRGAQGILASVIEAADTLLDHRPARDAGLAALGVGFGGPVEMPTGVVRLSHQVSGWEGVPLKRLLEERFGVPVTVDNDANAATLGELVFGAGRGLRDMVYINIGTGIGGGLVFGGRLYRCACTSAGEVGHTIVLPGASVLWSSRLPEALCSGTAIGRRARAGRADPAWPPDARPGMAILKPLPARLPSVPLPRRPRRPEGGDTVSISPAVGNLLNLLNPQAVILGRRAEWARLSSRAARARARCHGTLSAARILPARMATMPACAVRWPSP